MDFRRTLVTTLVLALCGAAPWSSSPATASEPADQLASQIDVVFKVLRDPELRQPGRDADRRAAVHQLATQIFDFNETARRILGSHWSERTADEQADFVRAFVALVDHAYLRRVDEYGGERVVVKGDTVEGNEGRVHTDILNKDGERIPVDFLVVRQDADRWRAYDVRVGGMSLVANYRAQFNKILRTGSYDELMRRLLAKSASDAR